MMQALNYCHHDGASVSEGSAFLTLSLAGRQPKNLASAGSRSIFGASLNAMSQRLHSEQWIPVPVPRVFAFFSDPHNLPRIMPPSQGAKLIKFNLVPPRLPEGARPQGLEHMAGPGTEITFKFRAIPYLPIHERWTALITEFAFNEYFADTQKQGPFKSWHHTHTFESKVVDGRDGTVVGDEVEYEVGFGVIGKTIETLIFQRVMRSIFEHRKQALERVFASEINESRVAKT
jgi:ligand-binding SRPBCC domain-containing protein